MMIEQKERQEAILNAIDAMNHQHLRWMIKTMFLAPDFNEMDRPLESLRAFLNQIEADYLFTESILDIKKTLDSSYVPYSSYYKNRLIELAKQVTQDLSCAEEGVVFETVSNEYESAFMFYWDGHTSVEVLQNKRVRMIYVLRKIVRKALCQFGDSYFNNSQKEMLASIIGVPCIKDLLT